MPRPKALNNLPLIPGKTTIDTSKFEKGFIGTIDSQGRVPTVGEEWRNREVIILIKRDGENNMQENNANDFLTHVIAAETNKKYPELNITPDDPRVQEHAKILEKIIEDMARWKDKQRD